MNIFLRVAMLAVALVAGSARAQSEAVPQVKDVDSIEARVQGCVTCHGQSGQGTSNGYFPRIAGKPAGYLYNQLRGLPRRHAPVPADELPGRVHARRATCARSPSTSRSSGRRSRRRQPPTSMRRR